MSDAEHAEHLQDKVQHMQLVGDALASALAAFVGHNHELIRLWDEAKHHGEVARKPRLSSTEEP